MRLLIIDDHPLNRRVLERLLSALGHEVASAESGEAVCARDDVAGFDLLLMDLHMPGLCGISAAAALRVSLGDACPPIFIITADVTEQTRRACAAANLDLFAKPITLEVIARMLTQVSNHAGPHARAPDAR